MASLVPRFLWEVMSLPPSSMAVFEEIKSIVVCVCVCDGRPNFQDKKSCFSELLIQMFNATSDTGINHKNKNENLVFC